MNWKILDFSTIYVSNQRTFLSEIGIYTFKKSTGRHIQLWLNRFCVFLYGNVENLLYLHWRIKNCLVKTRLLTTLGTL